MNSLRWHTRLRASFWRQAVCYLLCTAAAFALLLVMNKPHLGANAAMHWDAIWTMLNPTAVIPSKAEMANHREHLYDVVKVVGSEDPEKVSAAWIPATAPYRRDLEALRLYYSQLTTVFSLGALHVSQSLFHTPIAVMVAYQLCAMLLVAQAIGGLLAYAITRATPRNSKDWLRWIGVTSAGFVAIVSCPPMLSIARQFLTETVGFALLVPALLILRFAVLPRRSTAAGILLATMSGTLLFFTLRARYTLGPTAVLLAPLMWITSVPATYVSRHLRHYLILLIATLLPVAVLVPVDIHLFGPFILPSSYSDIMLKSTRLFFHTNPPYDHFLSALFVHLGLMLVSLGGIYLWLGTPLGWPKPLWQAWVTRTYAVVVVAVLFLLIRNMALQEVTYQPRHLLALSVAFVCAFAIVLPGLRWPRGQLTWTFVTLCGIVTAMNIGSSFGVQRRSVIDPLYSFMAAVRTSLDPTPAVHAVPAVIRFDRTYADWGDIRRLHDPIAAIDFAASHAANNAPSLLLIDRNIPFANWAVALTSRLSNGQSMFLTGQLTPDQEKQIRLGILAGQQIFLLGLMGNNVFGELDVRPLKTPARMDVSVLYQVVGFHTIDASMP